MITIAILLDENTLVRMKQFGFLERATDEFMNDLLDAYELSVRKK